MDPKLWEIFRSKTINENDEIEAVIRLDKPNLRVKGLRIISKFGPIATCRLKRKSIIGVRESENVVSLKASSGLAPEISVNTTFDRLDFHNNLIERSNDRSINPMFTGKGVVIGIVDWHCDFNHVDFLKNGKSRLLALWDQRGSSVIQPGNKYGYGTMYSKSQINWAIAQNNPYDALGYHPEEKSHGTHVMGIAAGNGTGGGPVGVAPEADLIFVHLANKRTGGLSNLGGSVRLLEAIDFISKVAGHRPWVINLSCGLHGGPHDGRTLVEMGIDYLLQEAPNRFLVQSAGNYFNKKIHANLRLKNGQVKELNVLIDKNDLTPNELEIWYSGKDNISVAIESPEGTFSKEVKLGENSKISEKNKVVGRIYNRKKDPNNFDNLINLFLDARAPSGIWKVFLKGNSISSGILHGWLERDDCPGCQARFVNHGLNNFYTTGTIANGWIPIVVGAYNAHSLNREVAIFSSAGPTRDNQHRPKPDLVAPGVGELSARSSAKPKKYYSELYTRKSGTSMAAPHVTGTVACCLQATNRPLNCFEIRNIILKGVDQVHDQVKHPLKYGQGYLNEEKVIKGALELSKIKMIRDDLAEIF